MGRHDRHSSGEKNPATVLTSGLVFFAAFTGIWAFVNPHPLWALIIAVFAGLLPASKGLSGLIAARSEKKALEEPRLSDKAAQDRDEKIAIRAARDHQGKVTASLLALESEMSVERAEAVLDSLAKKGHASLTVRDSGRVEYEFAEFLPVSQQKQIGDQP